MPEPAHKGFTLIELLVVIAIMAVIGAYTIINYRSFGDEQKLKSSASDVSSLLRTAQSNSTTGVKCQNQPALSWFVEIPDSSTLHLKCTNEGGTSTPVKTLTLSGIIQIEGITHSATPCTFPAVPPTSFTFARLYGTITSNCGSAGETITATLKSDKVGATIKSKVKIEPGGTVGVYME